MVGKVLDQCREHVDHGVRLGDRCLAQVDVLVVERAERGQSFGVVWIHPEATGAKRGQHDGVDERSELIASSLPADRRHAVGQPVRGHDAG